MVRRAVAPSPLDPGDRLAGTGPVVQTMGLLGPRSGAGATGRPRPTRVPAIAQRRRRVRVLHRIRRRIHRGVVALPIAGAVQGLVGELLDVAANFRPLLQEQRLEFSQLLCRQVGFRQATRPPARGVLGCRGGLRGGRGSCAPPCRAGPRVGRLLCAIRRGLAHRGAPVVLRARRGARTGPLAGPRTRGGRPRGVACVGRGLVLLFTVSATARGGRF